ncbi:MAG TPA: SDR family NAD(P)-dependent oxidoreductase [Thermoanaerobaculia bacterium]
MTRASERTAAATLAELKALFATVAEMRVDDVDAHESLGRYGLDSLMIVKITQRLAEFIEEPPSTLFFECRTLQEASAYLLEHHPDECARWTGTAGTADEPVLPATRETVPARRAAAADKDDRIAIIGIVGRYPSAESVDAFWEVLRNGRDCVAEVPAERWPLDGFYVADREEAVARAKSYSKWAGFIDGFAEFDPLFFNMSPHDAYNMDPQERLFLQASWAVLEDAGYTREALAARYRGRVGVFAGITRAGFSLYATEPERLDDGLSPHTSFAAVANRVSYLLDLHGPSLPVDTLCSASLAAVHEACEHIRSGACDMAIAGGVNLCLHPSGHIRLSAARMLSPTGRCRTFGAEADGYVPGEGVGAILLKPLRQAEADGDTIHAVILATSLNHGGKTNGYTVPNPVAQQELVREAIARAGVHPRTISYIEAHGTGTELGDPIEIAGLTGAFSQETADTGFCAIGSVKSNIGHLEAAAGIAGLTKIVLQMRHGQLVPTLHAAELNPKIDFARTPFVVQRELTEWRRPVIESGGVLEEQPRRAGVSSFGASGVNAHVLLEEYVDERTARAAAPQPAVIVLSARNAGRLRVRIEQLLTAIERRGLTDADLRDLAYTLQVGREAMEVRLALTVSSMDELRTKLSRVLAGDEAIAGVYRGEVKKRKDELALWAFDDDLKQVVAAWLEKGKWAQLLDFWVQGLAVDWTALYGAELPRRIPLPTYPFAKERLWFERSAARPRATAGPAVHPLVHTNTSSFDGQRFTSVFGGEEPFLKDHVIGGKRILPAVAYLEMACAATTASRADRHAAAPVAVRDIVWMQPLTVDGTPATVHIGLEENGVGAVAFEVYADETLYAKGSVETAGDAPERVDLDRLRAACGRTVSADACYAAFARAGLAYGEAHRAIRNIAVGTAADGEPYAIAELQLPATVDTSGYLLHPGILDGAIQAAIGLTLEEADAGPREAALPFALASAEAWEPAGSSAVVYVRRAGGKSARGQRPPLDFDVCAPDGSVRARMKGLTTRAVPRATESETLLLARDWVPAPPAVARLDDAARTVVVAPPFAAAVAELATRFPQVRFETFRAAQVAGAAEELLGIVKALPRERAEIQVLVPHGGDEPWTALGALLRTAHREMPALDAQLIEVPANASADDLAAILATNGPGEAEVRYDGGGRRVLRLREISTPKQAQSPWRDRGVYLITGGAGGLGQLWAEAIAGKVQGAQIVLAGRSAWDEAERAALAARLPNGASVTYARVDIGDAAAVTSLIEDIEREHGTLHGVLHAAGVTRDSFLLHKTPDELRAVLWPKVSGTLNLDRATAHLSLDLFLLFSSTAGELGNVGQADYALANAFLDRYAASRARRRPGRTLSLGWPLWAAGGMTVGAEKLADMRARGLQPIPREAGIAALDAALASGEPHVVVLFGDAARIRGQFLEKAPERPAAAPRREARSEEWRSKTLDLLAAALAKTLRLPAELIDPSAGFDRYGIDSILALNMVAVLEQDFGPLSKTLLFEYESLQSLGEYFLSAHGETLQRLFAAAAPVEAPAGPESLPAAVIPMTERRSMQRRRSRRSGDEADAMRSAIAVVGISGRYPQAPTLQKFWENLAAGRDCITEVPSDRWNHGHYFDSDPDAVGKTYAKWGGFLDGVEEFDPLFFNISPREAAFIDPQARLFLQTAYGAIEDAGYTCASLAPSGDVGVFVGTMYAEYQLYAAQAQLLGLPYALSGTVAGLANRLSYFGNFHGPSMTVDTMCSSSLTAIHLACESLRRGECSTAIAGGVNVSIHPNKFLMLANGKFAATDGRCHSFGEGGDGYVPGEAVGAVVLKPLARAIADGDHVYGLLRGSAINHGGRVNGYSVPNPNAQARVIARALAAAGVHPRSVSFLEAHGTGTPLGDPIEVTALTTAFGEATADRQFCALGSAKSNIGHCEGAAGIAGLTKVLLQMQHRTLVKSLHSEVLNPNIDFTRTPFVLQHERTPWARPVLRLDGTEREYPRIAGLSSFGAGGSNAHLIVEEHIQERAEPAGESAGPFVVVLSAKDEARLRERAVHLLEHVESRDFGASDMPGLAYTLQLGREAMEVRFATVVASAAELKNVLSSYLASEPGGPRFHRGEVRRAHAPASQLAADAAAWAADGKLDALAEAWAKGVSVDWRSLYDGRQPRRVSLPTYPFAKERYTIIAGALRDAVSGITTLAAPQTDARAERLLTKRWERAPLGTATRDAGSVVIVCNEKTAALAERLSRRLGGAQLPVDGEWSIDDVPRGRSAWIDLAGGRSLESIQALQQWMSASPREERTALCVTRGLAAHGNATPSLDGADRAGLFRMLSSEYRRLRSRHVDLDLLASDDEAAEQIAAELIARADDAEVCYRRGQRYRATLEEVPLPALATRVAFPADHVLLITGGTGGLGGLCARHFVTGYGVRRLVLTGREALPPRSEWTARRSGEDAVARKIRLVEELEAHGAQVHVTTVALDDAAALRGEIERIRQSLGPIGGVLHCAGHVDRESLAFVKKSAASMQAVFAPKIAGLDHLLASVAGEPLAFFVLFSSISAVVPTLAVSQADYAMANAYMDAVAEARAATLPIVSIQWPSWKESGIGETRSVAYTRLGLLSHTDAEGLRMLDRLVASRPAPVVLPAIVDANQWNPHRLLERRIDAPAAVLADADEIESNDSTVVQLDEREPAAVSGAQSWLTGVFAEELAIDPARIDPETPLHDYGIDSVIFLQVLRTVGHRVDATLDPSLLFQYPTVASFAAWLTDKYPDAFPQTAAEFLGVPRVPRVPRTLSARGPSEELRGTEALRGTGRADIAVVGLSCRWPGANGLDEFWQLLAEGRSAIRRVPPERWGTRGEYYAAVLDDVTHFDPAFFQIGEDDARAMDPQALLLLETALQLWHHAGYRPADVRGQSVGVYLGGRSQHVPRPDELLGARNPILAVGQNYLAANVSRVFDLHGPSVVIDSACSSALVAMDVAVRSLAAGDVDSAVVGGVSFLRTPGALQLFEQRGILGREPRFHLFDARSAGSLLGEGVGMVWLKTLDRAIEDGDQIYAVIKGIAINNDGRTAGPSAPNPQAQIEVIRTALARSGKQPDDITYVEVNGSGSEVNDLLELNALQAAYRAGSDAACELGSPKPNIGHTLLAGGIAGFMKSVLTLHRGQSVPFLSANEPMRHFDFGRSPFRFSRAVAAHAHTAAAVSSFADGGTNAHVILEAWPRAGEARRVPIPPPALHRIPIYGAPEVAPAVACFWDEAAV